MLSIKQKSSLHGTASTLPASKSISNRVLIISALAKGQSNLHNLSDANDTQLMLKRIRSTESVIDVEDAGTTMRFSHGLLLHHQSDSTVNSAGR